MQHMGRMMTAALLGAVVLVALGVALGPSAGAQAEEETLVAGWYQDREVQYYDFGTNTPLTSNGAVPTQPIWVFIHGMNADGTPDFVEGQHNIIDTVPGDTDYTAFWQVNLVTVPADYEPDSIRSAQDVLDAGFEITETDMLVNCPVVSVATTPGEQPTGAPSTGTGFESDGSAFPYWLIGLLAAAGALAAGGGLAFARMRR